MEVQEKTRLDAFKLLHSEVLLLFPGKKDSTGSGSASGSTTTDVAGISGGGTTSGSTGASAGATGSGAAGCASTSRRPRLEPRVVHKFLKGTVDYFYSAIASTAVRVFVKRLHELTAKCKMMPIKEGKPALRLGVPPAEARRLSAGHHFLYEDESFEATRDATGAVFARFGSRARFVNSVPGGKPVLVCLLAHVGIVATKIDEYLKRMGGIQTADPPGMNPGHRDPWRTMLGSLNTRLAQQRGETLNGLKLLDGDKADRAEAPEDSNGEGDLASFGHWVEVLDDDSEEV